MNSLQPAEWLALLHTEQTAVSRMTGPTAYWSLRPAEWLAQLSTEQSLQPAEWLALLTTEQSLQPAEWLALLTTEQTAASRMAGPTDYWTDCSQQNG